MSRWFLGVAVVAGCLCQPVLAQSQPSVMPTPYGAARTPPEPLPIGACPPPTPNLVPGPLTPDKAPQGPADCLSLPPSSPGAFQCENFPNECAIFASAGAFALQRQRLGKGAIAVEDLMNLNPTVKVGVVPAPKTSPPAQSFNDIVPNVALGPSMSIGVLAGTDIIEVTGYFIPRNSRTEQNDIPGRIFAYFFNAPPGFEGENGLFTQADIIRTRLDNQIGNVELNYRYSDFAVNGLELILGVRYFDVQERLATFVGQNDLTFPTNQQTGQANPIDQAIYTAMTHNRILAPQFGFEYNWGPQDKGAFSWLSLGFVMKGAWGMNFVNDAHSLVRGDGFTGFSVGRGDTIFSQMYELGGFAEVHFTERFKMRAGYNALWVLHIDAVVDQYEFDLSKPQGQLNHQGSVLYAGPSLDFEFLF
jgi:hypothetical protein